MRKRAFFCILCLSTLNFQFSTRKNCKFAFFLLPLQRIWRIGFKTQKTIKTFKTHKNFLNYKTYDNDKKPFANCSCCVST